MVLHYVTFFQPGCDWCRRQRRALEAHTGRCEGPRAIAIGLWGSVGELRREVAGSGLPAFRASPELLDAFDADVQATPLTLVTDPQRKILLTLRGYAGAEKLEAITTAILGPSACRRTP